MTEHCGKHEENTNDIAAIKANSRQFKWLLPLALAVAMGISSYIQNGTNSNIEKLANQVSEVKSIVQTAAINDAVYQVRLSNLENDVRTLKGNKQ